MKGNKQALKIAMEMPKDKKPEDKYSNNYRD